MNKHVTYYSGAQRLTKGSEVSNRW